MVYDAANKKCKMRLRLSVATMALAFTSATQAQTSQSATTASPEPTDAAQGATQPAESQQGDIIVTAQKRSERLQDVPIAITAVTGATLQNRRILDIVDLSNVTPGLQIKQGDTAANPRIFIRGVGLNDFNPATASAVGIYADGVYVASPLAQRFAFFDLQQAEVLRGPQGTLYGRNTTGGAINLTSRKPGNTYEADLLAEYGRFNSVNVQGGVTVPIVQDTLSARVAGIYNRDDGYTVNLLTGTRGNNTKRWAVRGSVRWAPSSDITDDLQVSTGKFRGGSLLAYGRTLLPASATASGPDGLCLPAYFGTAQCVNLLGYANTSKSLYRGEYRFQAPNKVDLTTVANTLTFGLGAADLVSVTGYQHAKQNNQEETDSNPLPMLSASYVARQNTFSQELRLQSAGRTRLRYVLGLYYAHDDLVNDSSYEVLPILPVFIPASIGTFAYPLTQKSNTYAAFSQLDFDVTDKLSITAGLRYSSDHKKFHYTSRELRSGTTVFVFDDSKTFSSVTGKAGVQYHFTPDINAYASYSRGAKSGGFFSGFTLDQGDIGPFRDEKVNAYEAGLKTRLLDRALTANISAFYYDYQDLQVFTNVVDGAVTKQLFTNASAARIYGAELELAATPVRGVTFTVNTAYLNAKYQDFVSAGRDYSGNRLPSAPKVSVQTGVNVAQPVSFGTIVADANVNFRSKIFFDTSNAARLSDPARAYVDARLGLRFARDRFEMGGWAKNLFDETNISQISTVPSLGLDDINVNPPRTYGLYLRAHY